MEVALFCGVGLLGMFGLGLILFAIYIAFLQDSEHEDGVEVEEWLHEDSAELKKQAMAFFRKK